ncbi:MAG: hypothetical protein FWE71_01840 [Nocardioidaceae bacterium]|nr:hypothetical protein [Nocardioidaceae bacterium]MCL2613840.1 hypothetical protein [Nocardioidaceae bacterium]
MLFSMLFGLVSLWCFGCGAVVTARWIIRLVRGEFGQRLAARAAERSAHRAG